MSDYILTKNKSISSFDILPNEILLLIFNYLTPHEIISSFFHCNQRFQHLLLTQKYHFKLPTTNLDFWNKTVSTIGPQIEKLTINIDHLTKSLDFFSNLKSMIISSPYCLLDGQLKSILNHPCFQQLHTLKIKNIIQSKPSFNENVLDDDQILLQKVFNDDNKLQLFEYLPSLDRFPYREFDGYKSNIHLRSLTLNLIEFQDMFIFIQHTPKLIYLKIQSKIPNKESEQFQLTSINQIKLEEFHLKFIFVNLGFSTRFPETDLDQLFRTIQLFSSSLVTLSLDFSNTFLDGSSYVLCDGIKLENQLLKPMNKLQHFYFYVEFYGCEDIEEILSTFETFPWPIGVHQNTHLFSLPFPFHELKRFCSFEDVRFNNDDILKHNSRLWSRMRSLELLRSEKIAFKNRFPLIKLNLPKLSSITFRGWDSYHPLRSSDPDDSYDEIESINVQLENVTTVCIRNMSMKEIEQMLLHSFPSLQCLTLDYTNFPLNENQLTSFLGQKLQRLELDESSLQTMIVDEKGFSYLCNLKHLKLTYDLTSDDGLSNSRSRMVSNILTKLPKLERFCIHVASYSPYSSSSLEKYFNPILNGLDQGQIKARYEIKYSRDCVWFIRNTVSSSL